MDIKPEQNTELTAKHGGPEFDEERAALLLDTVPLKLRETFVQCRWEPDNCYYCQRKDGAWEQITCV